MAALLAPLDAALELVRALYALDDPAALPAFIAPALRALIPSDFVVYNEIGITSGRIVTISDPYGPESRTAEFERWLHQHPLVTYYARTRDPSVLRMSDFISQPRLRDLELYHDSFGPLGINYEIVCTMPANAETTIALVLTRESGDFSPRECAVLELLRPHIVRAYATADARKRARNDDPDGDAVVVLRRDGTIGDASKRARALLARWFDDDTTRLPPELIATHEEGIVRVHRSDATLVARVLTGAEPAAVELHEEPPSSHERLRHLGLTRREGEVLACVAAGRTNAQIAQELDISVRTVKKHMEGVFAKLGVHTRTAAAAIARGERL